MLLSLALWSPAHAGMEEGKDAYYRGDFSTALKEWLPLAEAGDAKAQAAVGFLYHLGDGMPIDEAEAAKWFLRAAEQGQADAQFALATMYELGDGVERDRVQAYKWFTLRLANLAGGKDVADTAAFRDYTAAKMTPTEIAEAERLAREWRPAPE